MSNHAADRWRRAGMQALVIVLLGPLLASIPPVTASPVEGDDPYIDTAVALEGTPLVALALTSFSSARASWLAVIDTDGKTPPDIVTLPAYRGNYRPIAADTTRRIVYLGNQDAVFAYHLATRTLRATALPPGVFVGTLVVHARTGRLYVWASTGPAWDEGRTHIIEPDGVHVGEMEGEVVAIEPDLDYLYIRVPITTSSQPDRAEPGLLRAVNIGTGQTVAEAIVAGQQPGATFTRPIVDQRRNRLVAIAFPASGGSQLGYPDWRPTQLNILDSRDLSTIWSGPIRPLQARENQNVPLIGVNSATGRIYLASSSDASTLSTFGCLPPWEQPICSAWDRAAGGLVAIDRVRNRLYFARSERYNEHVAGMGRDTLLWLAVADGETETVRRLVPVHTPGRAPAALAPVAPLASDPDHRYFPETGHTIVGPFRHAWDERGGLAVLGYPLTESFPIGEGSELYVRDVTVQYFERGRLELHESFTSLQGSGTVTAQRLGLQFAAVRPPVPASSSAPERVRFDTYGHTVADGFKAFWDANGGVAAFGYPLTEEFRDINPTDGREYTVQYFERARFEYHPEHRGTAHEVQLGLLGRQVLGGRGWLR
ncbi:MAG: hypothetical protein IT340_22765 [Chloroflexi bacterium]|nr:hypothetical protein [Chloroflexota bacterium]